MLIPGLAEIVNRLAPPEDVKVVAVRTAEAKITSFVPSLASRVKVDVNLNLQAFAIVQFISSIAAQAVSISWIEGLTLIIDSQTHSVKVKVRSLGAIQACVTLPCRTERV